MATVTRRIGLSLGADICWPICYEDIVADLALSIPAEDGSGDTIQFEVERVRIEPFNLRQQVRYDVVLDRLTHWYQPSREWIKKAVLMDGVYVLNNPWSVQAMQKQTTYCAMMYLGLPIPDTVLVPPKSYEEQPDLRRTLESYANLFDLEELGARLGYPLFMKPFDGGGWVGVSRIDNGEQLKAAYETSGTMLMHLQRGVVPFERFVRCIGMGPQTKVIQYDPAAPLHERYRPEPPALSDGDDSLLEDITLTINAFFGWDFNSCEALLQDGTWYPIDFANPCPDSQVTSLHIHFPWLLKAKIKWSLFCAATKRKMRQTLDWQPFFAARERDVPYRERVRAYGDIARQHFDSARFDAFCRDHLGGVDRAVWEYFGGDRAREAVGKKVRAVYPEHEWDEYTDRFWQAIQRWRALEPPGDRAKAGP